MRGPICDVIRMATDAQHVDHRLSQARYEGIEELAQHRVLRRFDHGAVEGRVSVDVVLDRGVLALPRGECAPDRAHRGGGAALGGASGCLRLDGDPRLDHRGDVDPLQHSVPVFGSVECRDEHARPLARGEDSTARQLADRLAHSRAADAELRCQGRLAGQLRAQSPFARTDPIQQQLGCLIGQRCALHLHHLNDLSACLRSCDTF